MNNTLSNITVRAETTPNPASLKFIFSQKISEAQISFSTVEETEASPLAAKIFGFPWVAGVYLGENFVTITKQDWVDWKVIENPLCGLLAEHINTNQPVLLHLEKANDEATSDTPLIKQIKRTLQNEIKPVVAMDGGDIAFVKFENGQLFVKMLGACSGCPSSQATLKEGIEVRMKQLFSEINEVIAV